MASKLTLLKREALEACKTHKHKMRRFINLNEHKSKSWCLECLMEVEVNKKPYPNEIDIGGEAIALDCGDNDRRKKRVK